MARTPPPNGKEFLDAAKRGDQATMESLLQAQPELLAYNGKGTSLGFIGHSALHWAAAKGHEALARWLISQGASLEQRNNADSTALHTAAQNGKRGVLELLVAAGADAAARDADGKSPRDVALERGHSELGALLEKSASGAAARQAVAQLAESDSSVWKAAPIFRSLSRLDPALILDPVLIVDPTSTRCRR